MFWLGFVLGCFVGGVVGVGAMALVNISRRDWGRDGRPGICRMCGCTDRSQCEGGCGWADESATLCTNCVE